MATINGTSPIFKIRVENPDGSGIDYQFTHRYKKLRFYTEEFYKVPSESGRARSGKLLKKPLWIFYHYEIDFSEFIADEDAYKVEAVLNGEFQGKKLIINPSLDFLAWKDEIAQEAPGGSAGKKQLTQRVRAPYNKGSEGLVLNYVSVYPHTEVKWHNPANVSQVFLNKFYIK